MQTILTDKEEVMGVSGAAGVLRLEGNDCSVWESWSSVRNRDQRQGDSRANRTLA